MTDKQITHTLYVFEIPTIPRPAALPSLPKIEDPDLMRIATTHTSVRCQQRKRGDLEEDEVFSEDYEKLEHVGDAILGSIIVTLLHDLYPRFREGTAAMIKDQLVRNTTLAQIADWYGIPDLIQADPASRLAVKAQVKTKGSMFEAYIAGLFYSYTGQNPLKTVDRPAGVLAPLEYEMRSGGFHEGAPFERSARKTLSLLPFALEDDTNEEEEPIPSAYTKPPSPRQVVECSIEDLLSLPDEPSPSPSPSADTAPLSAGQAYDRLSAWLRPLLTPIAHYALKCMREEADRISKAPVPDMQGRQCPAEWAEEDRRSAGGLALLGGHAQKSKSEMPSIYAEQREGSELWEVRLTYEDLHGVTRQTEGTRYTKKGAAQIAAFKMCQLIGLA